MIQLRQLPRVQVQVQFQEKSWRTRTRLHSLEMHVLYRSVWWKNIGKPWKTSDQLASSGVFHGEMCRVSDPQTSQLGYAVTGGLWAAASLLSFMVSICTPLPFLYTSVQVWICHSYFLLRLHTHSKTFSFRRRLTTLCLLDLFFEIQLLWRPLFRDTPSSVKKLGATHFAQPPFRCFLQIDSEQ